jgi:AAA domain-containing protein
MEIGDTGVLFHSPPLDDRWQGQPREPRSGRPPPKILSSGEFIGGFVPPEYLLDGILQHRFIYSLTAPTGSGKTAFLLLLAAHTALAKPLGVRDLTKGRVVYFAGENPDDVRMRWIAMADIMDFNASEIDVHFIPGTFSIPEMEDRIRAEAETLGGFTLAIIDTSAAYFQGSDENSNTEMGKHARQLRQLTTLPGEPCVVVACHPVKNASNENLTPRGGGAFLAEVDGNLIGRKSGNVVDFHWQGKFRGPDFEPIGFRLESVTCTSLKDNRDRFIPTVVAKPVSENERQDMQAAIIKNEDQVLALLATGPQKSIAAIAKALGWLSNRGEPQKSKVSRTLDKLKRQKLVTQERDRWQLTQKGKEEAERIERSSVPTPFQGGTQA